MKFQSILVITYGRSGSTLLNGILNSIDRCLIRGENDNFIEGFYEAYTSFKAAQRDHIGKTSTNPWYGIQEPDEKLFAEYLRPLIKDLLMGTENPSDYDVYGFKEIRYLGMPPYKLAGYLKFLKMIFPEPCFVFNRRNHDSVCASGWFTEKDPERVKKKLLKFEQKCDDFATRNPNHTIVVQYEDIINLESGEIRRLFDFLGASYDAEKIKQVLNTRHSITYKAKSTNEPAMAAMGMSHKN